MTYIVFHNAYTYPDMPDPEQTEFRLGGKNRKSGTMTEDMAERMHTDQITTKVHGEPPPGDKRAIAPASQHRETRRRHRHSLTRSMSEQVPGVCMGM